MLYNYPGPRSWTTRYKGFDVSHNNKDTFPVIAAESRKSPWGVDRIFDINLLELSFYVHLFFPAQFAPGSLRRHQDPHI